MGCPSPHRVLSVRGGKGRNLSSTTSEAKLDRDALLRSLAREGGRVDSRRSRGSDQSERLEREEAFAAFM